MRTVRVTLAIFACNVLVGCSTGQIQPAITAFSDATVQAQSAFALQNATLTDAFAAETNAWAQLAPNRIRRQPGDCNALDGRCRLLVLTPGGDTVPFTQNADYVDSLMQSFSVYAAGLNAIILSSDPASFSKATESVKTSIVRFAATVEQAANADGAEKPGLGARVGAAAGPLSKIASVALRRYTDARKVGAIREAVLVMDPLMAEAVPIFERHATLARQIRIATARDKFAALDRTYRRGNYSPALIRDYREAAVVYDTALQADLTKSFATIRAAHHKLALAVNGRSPALRDFWPLIAELSADAAEAASAVGQLRANQSGS